jgi:hypothetical protein
MNTKLLYKKLAIFYYSAYFLAVLILIIGYFLQKNGLVVTNNLFIDVFKSIIIVYMLITIPLMLKFFSNKVRKIAKTENQNEKFVKYLGIAKMRITLVSVVFWSGIIAFYVMQRNIEKPVFDFLYIAAIGGVVLIFCKPTINKIDNDIMING